MFLPDRAQSTHTITITMEPALILHELHTTRYTEDRELDPEEQLLQ